MDPQWVFSRGHETFAIERRTGSGRPALHINHCGYICTLEFPDVRELMQFHVGLEARLVSEGWHLTEFNCPATQTIGF